MSGPWEQYQEQKPWQEYQPPTGIPVMTSDKPMLTQTPKNVSVMEFGRGMPVGGEMETDIAFKKRKADYYGFSEIPESMKEKYDFLTYGIESTIGREKDIQDVVNKLFGDQAKVYYHEGYGDNVLKLKDGKIVPLRSITASKQDLYGSAPQGIALGYEVAGAVGGSPGGFPGAAAGTTLGTFYGQYDRLKNGQKLGFMEDVSEAELLGEAAIQSAITLGLELTGGTIGVLLRNSVASPAAKKFRGVIEADDIDQAVSYAEKRIAELGPEAPEKLTAAQTFAEAARQSPDQAEKFRDISAQLSRLEEGLPRAVQAKELQVAKRAVPESVSKMQKSLEDDATALSEIPDKMQEIQSFLSRSSQEAQDKIARDTLEEEARLNAALIERLDVPDVVQTADEFRTYLRNAKEQVFDSIGTKYEDFYNNLPRTLPGNLKDFKAEAKILKKQLDKSILGSLESADAELLSDIIAAPNTVPIDQINRALSLLKSEQRMLSRGALTDSKRRNSKTVSSLINSLQAARDEALGPAAADTLKAIDQQYAAARQAIDESLVRRMIRKTQSGGYEFADNQLWRRLLASPTEINNIISMIKDPAYEGFVPTDLLRKGILGEYKRKILAPNATFAQHQRFVKDNKEAIEAVFGKDSPFGHMGSLKKMIDELPKKEQSLIRDLEKSFEYRLSEYSPEDLFNTVKNKPTQISQLKGILKDHPQKWADFQSLYKRDMLNRLTSVDDIGRQSFDFRKLDTALQEDRSEIIRALGGEYYNKLTKLNKIMKLGKIPKGGEGVLASLIPQEGPMGPTRSIIRIFARPLSRKGLAVTAINRLSRGKTKEAISRLLADPQKMREAIMLHNATNVETEGLRNILVSIGLAELGNAIQE